MDPKAEKPSPFINPFTLWTDLALKTGAAMIASAHALAAEAKVRRVGVIPAADAPAQDAGVPAPPATQATRPKAPPARARSRAKPKARARIKARARR